ncbi:nuclear pore complex protein Nup98-Nup96-like isoform X2 [Phlebotomus argentipes]|nr:nuclear pore complex protein Nup98-Nup96-like isoform X2 [Phlebotomus argentipes]
MKTSIHGKQWPLSSFSPFKDEPSLPDFLEDQSYEEVRWNFMLAKVENRLPQFQEEFKRATVQAFDKMSKLSIPDAAVKSYLIDIYGVNGRRHRQMKAGGTYGNAFSMATGDGGGRSIFDRISSNATTETSTFGGSNSSSFSGGSIFGGGSTFGTSATPQKSIFGQQSVFGQTQQATQSIFGQTQAVQPTNSFFKMSQLGAPQAASGGNIFAQPMQTQQVTFGGQNAFATPANPPQMTSIFGGGFNNAQAQPMSTDSIFGGGGGGSFSQPTTVFGQNAPQFGQSSVLAPASFATPAPQSVFGQPAASPQIQPTNVFGQMNIQQPVQNTFQQSAPASVFGTVATAPPPPPPVSSVFSAPSPFAAPAAPPALPLPQLQQPPQQQTQQTNPTFFATPQPPAASANPALYSKLENLTPADLEAFKADTFVLGKIPTVPPPIELCGL